MDKEQLSKTPAQSVEDEEAYKRPGKSRYISQKVSMMERTFGSQVKENTQEGCHRAGISMWLSI
jgi:hypothetical protein